MKISMKGQYAIKAMIHLAINNNKNQPVSLTELSLTQTISISYLEQLFSILRRSGLAQGVRGPGGGYRLGKAPDQISIADILLAIVDYAKNPDPERHFKCKEDENSLAASLWEELSMDLLDYLDSITLADVVKGHIQIKNHNGLDETTRRISTMFPVTAKLMAA